MLYTLPPRYDVLPPAVIYQTTEFVPMRQLEERIGEYTVTGLHADGLEAWISELRQRFRSHADLSGPRDRNIGARAGSESAEALKRVLERTGWSLRKAGEFFDRSHIQIARVRSGESSPRDSLANAIADADILTRTLFPVAGEDPSTLSRMLLSRPVDGAEETATDAFRRGDLRRAMSLARRVLYPRTHEMINVPEAPFSKYDAAKALLDT